MWFPYIAIGSRMGSRVRRSWPARLAECAIDDQRVMTWTDERLEMNLWDKLRAYGASSRPSRALAGRAPLQPRTLVKEQLNRG